MTNSCITAVTRTTAVHLTEGSEKRNRSTVTLTLNSEFGDQVGSGLSHSQENNSVSPSSISASTARLLKEPTSTVSFV
jgi:hypothetical protein